MLSGRNKKTPSGADNTNPYSLFKNEFNLYGLNISMAYAF
jgi:hypothetical protein